VEPPQPSLSAGVTTVRRCAGGGRPYFVLENVGGGPHSLWVDVFLIAVGLAWAAYNVLAGGTDSGLRRSW
jgi:hypothetical protein